MSESSMHFFYRAEPVQRYQGIFFTVHHTRYMYPKVQNQQIYSQINNIYNIKKYIQIKINSNILQVPVIPLVQVNCFTSNTGF